MNTRIASVQLAGEIRVLYNCSVRVPIDVTEEEMKIVISHLYDLVEGSEYNSEDPIYWKEGQHQWTDHSVEKVPDWEVSRDRDGAIRIAKPKEGEGG